jgi:hypothetical protein
MSKNNDAKISRVDLDILYSHKVVSRENDIFVLCVKKNFFDAKIGVARNIFLVFFTQDTKNAFFCET